MQQQISICIPTYNRPEMTIRAFKDVHNDDRVKEVVIVDDNSRLCDYEKLYQMLVPYKKVKMLRNMINLGVYGNKAAAVKAATSEYVILFDSDNVMTLNYLDVIYKNDWHPEKILSPDFAKPVFDYTKFAGQTITSGNVSKFASQPLFDCLANTMNFFVNREHFLAVWTEKKDIKGADSIYFFYLWLLAGFSVYVTPELRYLHTVHNGSYYQSVAAESEPMCKLLLNYLKQMK